MPRTIRCPECQAAVKVGDDAEPGRTLLCPECEAYFTPGQPARPRRRPRPPEPDDDADDLPRKKFPVGTAVAAGLLVLLIAGIVVGIFWYRGQQADRLAQQEREQAEIEAERARANAGGAPTPGFGKERPNRKPGGGKQPAAPPQADLVLNALTGGPQSTADAQRTKAKLSPELVGTWRTKPGAAPDRTVEYRADGTFRDEVAGPTGRVVEGKWEVADALGKKGLKLTRAGGGPGTVRVTFEDGELIHDADEPGTTSVLVKG